MQGEVINSQEGDVKAVYFNNSHMDRGSFFLLSSNSNSNSNNKTKSPTLSLSLSLNEINVEGQLLLSTTLEISQAIGSSIQLLISGHQHIACCGNK